VSCAITIELGNKTAAAMMHTHLEKLNCINNLNDRLKPDAIT
jgi:hypothetical protein